MNVTVTENLLPEAFFRRDTVVLCPKNLEVQCSGCELYLMQVAASD